jgi:hypothetical protein
MTQTVEVMENQAQEFISYAEKKGFVISQEFIDAVIAELKSVNMWRESVSLKTFKMGLAAAIDSGKVLAPVMKPIDIVAAAEQLSSRFPSVVTIKKVRKESSTDYVNSQSGRATQSEKREMDARSSAKVATAKDLSRLADLRSEYRSLRVKAETAMGSNPRNWAETFSVRKEALQRLNSDPRFAEVRSE